MIRECDLEKERFFIVLFIYVVSVGCLNHGLICRFLKGFGVEMSFCEEFFISLSEPLIHMIIMMVRISVGVLENLSFRLVFCCFYWVPESRPITL